MSWIFHPAAVNLGSISHSEWDGDRERSESADQSQVGKRIIAILVFIGNVSEVTEVAGRAGRQDTALSKQTFAGEEKIAGEALTPWSSFLQRTDIAVALWCHCRYSSRTLHSPPK